MEASKTNLPLAKKMENLIASIQSLYDNGGRSLGAQIALDELLSSEGWTDGKKEMSWSGHYYRTRKHTALGEWSIECDSILNSIAIKSIDCDGFTHAWKTVKPTPEQQVVIDSEIKAIMDKFEFEAEEEYYESEFEHA